MRTIHLRKKLLLLNIAITLATIIAIISVSKFFIENEFLTLEEDNAQKNITRVKNTIGVKLDDLQTLNRDYAGWDDTYQFIQDKNNEYIESNLVNETFESANINIMAFIDNKGEKVYTKYYNDELKRSEPIPTDFENYLGKNSPLTSRTSLDSYVSGLIAINDSIYFVSSEPITTSQRKGPIMGSLIMAREFDANAMDSIRKTTELNIDFYKPTSQDQSTDLIFRDKDTISALGRTRDINGNQILVYKANLPRYIFNEGKTALNYLIASLVTIGILSFVISFIYIDKIILKPLNNLIKEIKHVRSLGNLETRINIAKNDEFGKLEEELNSMLDSIQISHLMVEQANQELAAKKKLVPEK